ncbi:Acyltransferase family protein [Pseudoruegeria aquimaris]|uniref:Acyltransferase family protein n=1 Tax=Pseudoruegeria aquimaris TaxID=393663 RepID=A0A1Y5THB8_9RHOB|nr:acyltransferase [Pseudoruegeria aquimaris]SLN62049.1 Acyltransferase family protein [Pseudoruegeria aquimaris]
MPQARHTWIDALRLTAGVSMIGLHASSDAAGQPYPDATVAEKAFPLIARAFIYTARTELFFLISIFLLLMALDHRPRSYAETIAQQARRLLVPFLFWTLFYAVWNFQKATAFGYLPGYAASLADPETWLRFLLLGESKYHMHFLPTLFGILLAYPLYRIAVSRPWLGLLFVVGLALKREADVYLWSHAQEWAAFPYLLRAVKILSYGGYGLLAGAFYGLFLKHGRGTWPRWALPLAAATGLGLLAIKLWHMGRVMQRGDWDYNFLPGFWADYTMPAILFLCAMLMASRHWPERVSRVAPFSFGLYLCHPIFLDLAEMATARSAFPPTSEFLLEIGFAVIATSCFVLALSRIRSLAWTIGLGPLPRPRWQQTPNISQERRNAHV